MNHKKLQYYFAEIQSLVSCPDKIYKQLYLTTLNQFATHCPANELNSRIKISISTIKLSRGILLPKNTAIEVIAAEEAQWRYALFSASLLMNLENNLIKKIVPDIAENWLINNPLLYKQWYEILFNDIKENNFLNEVIEHALELSAI